jgi:hypothetical protein
MWGYSIEFWEKVFFVSAGTAAVTAVIAAFAAFVSGIVGYQISDRLQKASDEKIADSQARVADAKLESASALERATKAEEKVAGANERIANAELRAAEANRIAEGERLARVRIEERLAPRSLTQAQIAGLTNRLKPYSGTPVDILQFGESPEITNFRALIEQPLRAAGWNFVSSTAVGSGSLIGIAVALVEGSPKTDETTAEALLSALNAEGILTANGGLVKREAWPGFVMAPPGIPTNKAAIRIYIGSKM